jgi:hypothetical protein
MNNEFESTYMKGSGGKAWPGRDADHSPPVMPRSRMSGSYISSPP